MNCQYCGHELDVWNPTAPTCSNPKCKSITGRPICKKLPDPIATLVAQIKRLREENKSQREQMVGLRREIEHQKARVLAFERAANYFHFDK